MILVIAHRSVAASYEKQPWGGVLSAAQNGAEGLRIWEGKRGDEPVIRPRIKDADEQWVYAPGWEDWDEICMFRECDPPSKNVTCLFKRNWFVPSSRPMSTDPAVVAEWEKSAGITTPV
jgi:hypothetical protein